MKRYIFEAVIHLLHVMNSLLMTLSGASYRERLMETSHSLSRRLIQEIRLRCSPSTASTCIWQICRHQEEILLTSRQIGTLPSYSGSLSDVTRLKMGSGSAPSCGRTGGCNVLDDGVELGLPPLVISILMGCLLQHSSSLSRLPRANTNTVLHHSTLTHGDE